METKIVTKNEMIEQFNKDFKIFKRFLKEKGKYSFVMNYLFPPGVTLSVFRTNAIKKLYASPMYDFRDLLHIISTLGPSYNKLGHGYWENNFSHLSEQFIIYYGNKCGNKILYKIKDVGDVLLEEF